jgi:3-hydroxyisobutyrate dehydrogenase-like beta-hydroxyacid dehydrogenase
MAAVRKVRSRVGVIGLGIIGSRVAANLRAAGHQVYVWSRSPHSSPNFLGSVVEVADLCEVIQIFVSNDVALLEVIRTIAAALAPHHVICGHATVSPKAARQAAAIVESQGARYLDAPFTGSKAAAQNKQMVYYVGGDDKALADVQAILAVTAKKVLHVGKVGEASVIKIATNMLTATTVQTVAEALALVRAAGVEGQRLAEALEQNASQSGTSAMKLTAMLTQNFEPNFSLKHMCKDLRLALDLAQETQVAVPATATTAEIFGAGLGKGWEDQDFSVVARNYPLPDLPALAPVTPPPSTAPDPAPKSVPVDGPGASPAPIAAAIEKNGAPAPGQPGAPAPLSTEQSPEPGGGPSAQPSVLAPVVEAAPAAASRKSLLQVIREFFKPQPAERQPAEGP